MYKVKIFQKQGKAYNALTLYYSSLAKAQEFAKAILKDEVNFQKSLYKSAKRNALFTIKEDENSKKLTVESYQFEVTIKKVKKSKKLYAVIESNSEDQYDTEIKKVFNTIDNAEKELKRIYDLENNLRKDYKRSNVITDFKHTKTSIYTAYKLLILYPKTSLHYSYTKNLSLGQEYLYRVQEINLKNIKK